MTAITSTPVHPDPIDEIATPVQSTALIDLYLGEISGRSLVSTDEVTDLLLDIRLSLTGGHP